MIIPSLIINRYLSSVKCRPAVAGATLSFPFIKQIFTKAGAIAATFSSMSSHLKKGESVALAPGGIAELFLSSSKHERVLATHHGFVRLALKHGSPIVPAYAFGHTRMFKLISSENGWSAKASRLIRGVISYYYGPYFLPVIIIILLYLFIFSLTEFGRSRSRLRLQS